MTIYHINILTMYRIVYCYDVVAKWLSKACPSAGQHLRFFLKKATPSFVLVAWESFNFQTYSSFTTSHLILFATTGTEAGKKKEVFWYLQPTVTVKIEDVPFQESRLFSFLFFVVNTLRNLFKRSIVIYFVLRCFTLRFINYLRKYLF